MTIARYPAAAILLLSVVVALRAGACPGQAAPSNSMSFFLTSAGLWARRQPRRPQRRGSALPEAGDGGGRRQQDVARLL